MLTTILVFLIILGLLVFVHEFGHFIVAKKSGMQVDEFGFGFPPRIFGVQVFEENQVVKTSKTETIFKSFVDIESPGREMIVEKTIDTVREVDEFEPKSKWHFIWGHGLPLNPNYTVYSINWFPLGGFVKIRGENNEFEDDPRSFINRPFWGRLATLVAGVFMNFVLAWVLMSIGLIIGLPAAVDSVPKYASLKDPHIAIMQILPGEPAAKAGLMEGDTILSIDNHPFTTSVEVSAYVKNNEGKVFVFDIQRENQQLSISVQSLANPGPDQGPTGIALASAGNLTFPWYLAPYEGLKTLGIQTANVATGLYQLVTGKVSVKNLGGPIKIAQLTGQVSRMGFIYLLQFTAFLSINLAVLNILPFPALDGGRVLFLIIEKIRRKRNNQTVEQWFNTIGFALLILLMVFVSAHDVFNIFHK
jgi:regulator of sigma E protease